MVSLALVLPVLPGLVESLIDNKEVFFLWYGAATFAFAVSFFISAGVAGRLSDRFGRRPMMIACCGGLAAGYFACAMSPGIVAFIASRALCGLFSANLSLSQAYVADLSAPAERGRRFGLLGVVQGLGFLIGPLLGGQLGQQDLRIPFFAASGLALAGGFTAVFLLRESLPAERRSGAGGFIPPI
jgi:DHA1 family tetracycline resistance protein-like MFS transporter